MDSDTRAEINTLWKQGIDVLRKDFKEFKDDYREDQVDLKRSIYEISHGMIQSKRWVIGMVVMAIPAYIAAIAEFLTSRK